jgi:hypothetical protein
VSPAGTLAFVERVVETATTWQLCACDDGVHAPADRELAKGTREQAARGLAYYVAGEAHLLRLTTTTVAEPVDTALDMAEADAVEALAEADTEPEPYDPFDPYERQDLGW